MAIHSTSTRSLLTDLGKNKQGEKPAVHVESLSIVAATETVRTKQQCIASSLLMLDHCEAVRRLRGCQQAAEHSKISPLSDILAPTVHISAAYVW